MSDVSHFFKRMRPDIPGYSGLSSSKKYLFYADVMRTIGIIAVIIIHTASRIIEMFGNIDMTEWWIANLFSSCSRWAVPLFVMLSGTLILSGGRANNTRAFFKGRLQRIGFPFIFWSAVYFIWLKSWYHLPINTSFVLKKIIFGGAYYHFFFLYLISLMYILTPLLRKIINRYDTPLTTVLLATFFLCTGMINSFFFYKDYSPGDSFFEKTHGLHYFTFLFSFTGYFLAGYLIGKSKPPSMRLKGRLIVLMVSFIATSFITFMEFRKYGPYHFGYFAYDYFSPVTILSSLVIFSILKDIFSIHQPTNTTFTSITKILASASFGIYLNHIVFLDILKWMVGISGTSESGVFINLHSTIYLLSITITTLISGLIFTLIMHKIPLTKPFSGYSGQSYICNLLS